mgnify:FL=1
MKKERPYQRKRRRRCATLNVGWTKEAETDLEFLATALRASKSAAVREAVRRCAADELKRLGVLPLNMKAEEGP